MIGEEKSMIHVDVRKEAKTRNYLLETSVDGGPWTVQYLVDPKFYASNVDVKLYAEDLARAFISGCRFCGADVRATSCGYEL